MNTHVTKWVACFDYAGKKLTVMKGRFRKTAKLYILIPEGDTDPIYKALSYGMRFAHDDWRLSDSAEAALVVLFLREDNNLKKAVEKVGAAKNRLALITREQAKYAVSTK